MEGIAGGSGDTDKDLVRTMLDRIRHRGPGSTNVVADDRAILGANAPAPEGGGRSEAVLERDGVSVACDAYFLNRAELTDAYMASQGARVSDAELVLSMYKTSGLKMFGMLDGAFTIAIMCDGRLTLARDAYGLKPLYISGNSSSFVFSSEMKAQMLAEGKFEPFPPGKVMVQGKGMKPIRPARASSRTGRQKGKPEEVIRRLLVASVHECVSLSRVANVLLSGGLDSSVVAAAAALVPVELKTVCVGLEGGKDLDMALKVAEHLGTDHKERIFSVDEMIDSLDEVIYAAETFDYPLVRSCIPNYMATHLFGGPSRTVLCGEGGDEIFAGYDYMREITDDKQLRKERLNLLNNGHMTGFQRVDRMTASASMDGRMPLMHGGIVALGMSLTRKQLVGPGIGQNKLALRRAFSALLPPEIAWRKKQRFSDGAGSITAMQGVAEELISDEEFEHERKELPKGRIRTKEELMYFRVFKKYFYSQSAYQAVGFTERP